MQDTSLGLVIVRIGLRKTAFDVGINVIVSPNQSSKRGISALDNFMEEVTIEKG